jgi:chemotaxis protein histidine kinase CheA
VGLILASAVAFAGTLTINLPKDTLYEITSDVENKKVEQIQEALKAANERLDKLTITRNGDVITLGFAMWTEGDKVSFNLIGKKPDFYKMAMGVAIEDTLRYLVKSDTRVLPANATKDSETISITLIYGEGGKPPKALAPTKVSAKARAKTTAPKAAKTPDAPAPAPTPPPAQNDTAREDADWSKLKSGDDIDALQRFINKYPRSMHKHAAKRKINEIKNRAANEIKEREAKIKRLAEAEKNKKAEAKRLAAKKKQQQAEDKKRRAEKAKHQAEEQRKKQQQKAVKRVDDAYAAAKKAGTSKALDKFAKANPKAKQVSEVKKLSAKLKDDEAYSAGYKTRKGVEGYLKKYPKGRHVKEGKVLLGKMADDETFLAAKGSIDALEKYLQRYPKGRNAKEANSLIGKLLSSGPLRLRALAVKTPPKVDGKGDDAAWKGIRPLTLALKKKGKGKHIPRVTVKAVHSGGKLYVLAQWKDSTNDSDYRPYIWDKKANKHTISDTLDDAFSMAIYKGELPKEACMLGAKTQEVDLWVWRAFLSDISGLASDQSIVTSRKRMRKSTPHMARNGSGQIWIRNLPDKGKLGWKYVVPMPDAPKKNIPSYKRSKPSGSAGDVSARGSWNKGVWTVEFSRDLKTGNADDADIPAKGQVVVSFAAYDKADRENHSSGQLVRLELQR